jgi:hypothetical protein
MRERRRELSARTETSSERERIVEQALHRKVEQGHINRFGR